VWWFLPSDVVERVCTCCGVNFQSGRIHRRGELFNTLVLPSLNRNSFCEFFLFCLCRGDYTGEEVDLYSRSPLSFIGLVFVFLCFLCFMSGRFTVEYLIIIQLSFSPLWTDFFTILLGSLLWAIFVHFYDDHFCHDPRLCVVYHSSPRACIMYIYSLGHFLTTKGALIDGDWGGVKNCHFSPKWPKKVTRNHEKVMKNSVKKWSKKSDS